MELRRPADAGCRVLGSYLILDAYLIRDPYGVVSPALNASLSITLLLLLVEQFFEMQHEMRAGDKADRGKSRALRFIQRDKGIIGQLCKHTYESLDNTIKFDEENDGFTLANSVLALRSYVEFWELLVEEQASRKRSNPLHLEITHSCEIDIWTNHHLTERLIEVQQRFAAKGGKITRVFCGRGSEPHDAIKAAIHNMHRANVNALYYDISKGIVDSTFSWDFLHVKETGKCVIWSAFSRGEVIEEAIYVNTPFYRGCDLAEMWSRIASHSTSFSEYYESSLNGAGDSDVAHAKPR